MPLIMPPLINEDDDDVELVPVPMDRETRRRLVELSKVIGDQPYRVAGSLLRDVLKEDEDAHAFDKLH